MPTYTPKQLCQGGLGNAPGVMYTVPAGQLLIVKQIIVTNTSSAVAAIYVRLVPVGGTGANTNDILSNVDVPSKSVLLLDLSQVLPAGGTIVAYGVPNNTLNITASGLIVT